MDIRQAHQANEQLTHHFGQMQQRVGQPSIVLSSWFWGECGVFGTESVFPAPESVAEPEKRTAQMLVFSTLLGQIEAKCEMLRREWAKSCGPEFAQMVEREKQGYLRQWDSQSRMGSTDN